MKKYLKNVICAIVLLAVTGCVGYLCFAYLGKPGTNNTDEARHIANAYEMLRNGDFWISSYRGATDYFNYKPPLSMWCIMLNFASFGINSFTMRMYSAISFVLLFVILSAFCWKKFSPIVAAVWGIPLICMNDIFFFHCARNADADALYLLMFSVGMIFLYLAKEKPKCLMGFGFFMSLAFMAKCLHVASAAVIFVLFLPAIWKKAKINDYILMAISAIIPTGVWLLVRYSFDGFTFIKGMFSQEVADKVEAGKDYLGYIKYFASSKAIITAVILIILIGIVSFFSCKKSESDKEESIIKRIVYSKGYLFVLWVAIPFAIYSASGNFAMWYGYVSYIPLFILFAIGIDYLFRINNIYIKSALLVLAVAGACWSLVSTIPTYVTDFKYMKDDGNVGNVYLRRDLEKLIAEHPEVRGYNIYLENLNQEYAAQNEWEVSGVADAYIIGDFTPLDGGVPMFIDDENSILIISKDLFENYYDVLVGRVQLEEGEYFVFDHKYYGEE